MDPPAPLARLRLGAIPPVRGIVAAIALGLLIPGLLAIDTTPTELASGLARERLARFLATASPFPHAAAPVGEILSERPAFHWRAAAGAERYRFILSVVRPNGDETWVGPDVVREPRYLLRAPGRLDAGRVYTYS
ncbi:MAG: hypothetical protein ACREID_09945, partial [Planctomycetota bacterium]